MSTAKGSRSSGAAVFVSYRRSDGDLVVALNQRLASEFGARRVFLDVESLRGGQDFMRVIVATIKEASVVLAVIGPNWALHLDFPDDPVRVEIATAFAVGIPVIPILLKDTPMPSKLPSEIGSLSSRNALPLRSGGDFNRDTDRVSSAIFAGFYPASPESQTGARDQRCAVARRPPLLWSSSSSLDCPSR